MEIDTLAAPPAPALTSAHTVDVRPLDRHACIAAGRIVRQNVDLPLLVRLVDRSLSVSDALPLTPAPAVRAERSAGKGKKRARESGAAAGSASPSPSPAKKARRNTGTAGTTAPAPAALLPDGLPGSDATTLVSSPSDPAGPADDPPPKSLPAPAPAPPTPVLTLYHTSTLTLTRGPAEEHFPPSSKLHRLAWLDALNRDEEALVDAVGRRVRADAHTPAAEIDLGPVRLRPYGAQLRLSALLPAQPQDRETPPLLTFAPPAPFAGQAEEHDFSHTPSSSATASLLHAAGVLAALPLPRVGVRSTLSVALNPPAPTASASGSSSRAGRPSRSAPAPAPVPAPLPLALTLTLHTTVLLLPAVFDPPSVLPLHAQEAQRMLLSHLFCHPYALPGGGVEYPGETGVRWFYDLLRPAPGLAVRPIEDAAGGGDAELEMEMERHFQPDRLDAQLLPFQRRSVAWLLGREGVRVRLGADRPGQAGPERYFLYERATSPFLSRPDNAPAPDLWYAPLTGSLVPYAPAEYRLPPAVGVGVGAEAGDGVLGGMLSEEMGLGKTLECLALVLLNPAPGERGPGEVKVVRGDIPDAETMEAGAGAGAGVKVREVRTTLIVCPASLQQQWADEIGLHAPELRVRVYKGWRRELDGGGGGGGGGVGEGKGKGRKRKRGQDEDGEGDEGQMVPAANDEDAALASWAASTHTYDILLATYDDVRKEFYVSQPRKVRPKRESVAYAASYAGYFAPGEGGAAAAAAVERREVVRCPLVAVEWWRVIMDEVQLQGDGKAAAVVSLIPRRSSIAVSGTPVQDDIRDLVQVLKFLRVPVLADSPRLWARLLKPAFAREFAELFQRIGIRTLKQQVAGELTIPPQRRYLVPIEMGPVERHLYNDLLESAYNALGLDASGNPTGGGPDPALDISQLRTQLLRLRQSCTHPQIGQLHRNDRVLGGALRSIAEVLDLMRYQNRQGILNEKRDRLDHRVKHALLIQLDEQNAARWKQSLELFLVLKDDAQALVDEVRAILDAQRAAARAERRAAKAKARGLADSRLLEDAPGFARSKGKGKGVAVDDADAEESNESDDGWLEEEGEEEGEEDAGVGAGRGRQGKENRLKTSNIRIRECYVLQHKIYFAIGDLYHRLGKTEEDEAYGDAERVRRRVLKTTEEVALRAMSRLMQEVAEKGVGQEELEVGPCGKPGLRATRLFFEADDIIDLLNDQRDLLWKWRGMIFTRLTQKLTTGEGEEASGEEYTHALDAQGEAEAYIVAYAAILAERKEALSQERTILALHESREKKARETRAALNAGVDATLAAAAAEMEPQNEVLLRQLNQERKDLKNAHSKRSLKAVFLEMSGAADQHEREIEGTILKAEALRLRRVVTDQEALCTRLEAELALFRQAFNGRIVYFRQLQELSDSVMDLDVKKFSDQYLQEETTKELDAVHRLDDSLRKLQAKQRYLDNMDKDQKSIAPGTDNTEARECVLCATEFENGCLTACGHIYCEDCLKAWLKKPGNKFCPVCRQPISKNTIHRIVFHAGEKFQKAEEDIEPEPLSATGTAIDYNVIDAELLREIDQIEAHGSYGSKVQALVKHLLYLKMKEPEAKSIVFSAWVDSLNIIARALQENGISCIRVEAGRNAAREFRLDPACRVLLLHGERENAGLNVTCANRVFLLEPVVNHAFEIQAIGRVDRMGQTRDTEVFCYYAIDTVEKGVLDLAARNGVSIYTKGHARGTLSMSALGEEGASRSPRKGVKGKGDFMAKAEDMRVILFPHLAETENYNDVMEVDMDIEADVERAARRREAAAAAERRIASAGPSRLQ